MWDCVACLCKRIAHDLRVCPACGEEKSVPKVTSGGVSNQNEPPQEAGVVAAAEVAASTPEAAEQAPAQETAAEAEQAASLEGEHGPEPDLPPGSEVEPGAASASGDYASMTQAALREEAKGRGLPVGGSKADLAGRLAEHDAASAGTAASEPPPAPAQE